MPAYQDFPWRVGRKVGRTVYAVVSRSAGDNDVLIGVMDTPHLAREAVACHNRRLGWADPEETDQR